MFSGAMIGLNPVGDLETSLFRHRSSQTVSSFHIINKQTISISCALPQSLLFGAILQLNTNQIQHAFDTNPRKTKKINIFLKK